MGEPDFAAAQWVTSDDEGLERCIEFAAMNGWISVRDSKRGDNGPVLALTPEAMSALLTGIEETRGSA